MHRYLVFLVCLIPGMLSAQVDPGALARFSIHWNQLIDAFAQKQVSAEVTETRGLSFDPTSLRLSVIVGEGLAFRVKGAWDKNVFEVGRQGNTLWIYSPEKTFGLRGDNSVALFRADPDYFEIVDLNAMMAVPFTVDQVRALPALFTIREVPSPEGNVRFEVSSNDFTRGLLGLSGLSMVWHFDRAAGLPAEVSVDYQGKTVALKLAAEAIAAGYDPFAIPEGREADFQDVALSHLTKFFRYAGLRLFGQEKQARLVDGLIATHGRGRLEVREGHRILYLEGSAAEMGEQHGVLLGAEARRVCEMMLYGAGIGRGLIMGSWFFGDIEDAQARLLPYMNPDYLVEMDALALASGMHPQELRLANFFPELFHCSGFAVFNEATEDGMLYHGRILDYMMGMGLEDNAVVMIINPDDGYRWVNLGYAGFTGTVTAMNEKGVAIGEMGGGGWGEWDGKPMAQLMRETMERAATVEEGLAIFERGPRTCEYYYVLSQANPNYAVGLYATPTVLEKIYPGTLHARLPRPVEAAVLLSAGNRYTCLVDRVEEEYGSIDAEKAWSLMARPVAMSSNIQSALFRPETLDFWIANAGRGKVASARQPAQFNLQELLQAYAHAKP